MSSGALFGSNASRGASKNLVEFKAGKMTMKGNMVYPDTRKGQLYVYQSDDSLMHFCWKDRTSGVVEDDLIIFPDDCEFKHVPQCTTGRVYLLRFKSSNKKFFVWLQDLKTDKDEEHCRKINEVLNNPPTPASQRNEGDIQNLLNNMSQQQLIQLFGGVGQINTLGTLLGTMNRPRASPNIGSGVSTIIARAPTTQAPTPTPTSTSTSTTTTESAKPTNSTTTVTSSSSSSCASSGSGKIQLSDLQNFLSAIPAPAKSDPAVERGVATELTNVIPAAISMTGNLESAMSAHLPPGDNLCTTLSSPQFSQALSMFWSTLQSGQAGQIVRQFGMGPDAINAATSGNIEEFVNALESEAKNGQGQPQQGQEEKSTKQSPPGTSPEKKDDDDEGMSLD